MKTDVFDEYRARQILSDHGSRDSFPVSFDATKLDGGWLFTWADSVRPAPVDLRGIVVSDDGQVARVEDGTSSQDTLDRLAKCAV